MESLEIKSVDRASCIEFVDREPFDATESVEYFTVRLKDANLSASARVYASMCSGLPVLFANVARNWRDFTGSAWSSLEGEFSLEISHDGIGHFTIVAQLRSGHDDRDWEVKSSVMVETAQLDRIAADISEFIGHHS